MANNSCFIWEHQFTNTPLFINDQAIDRIKVQIFHSNSALKTGKILNTDGQFKVVKRRTFITNFTFVIVSEGILFIGDTHKPDYFYINIKVYLSENFTISLLDKDFEYKTYIEKAIQAEEIHQLSKCIKKVGSNDDKVYPLLEAYARNYDFDKVEQLFKEYKISAQYQVLFWKQMYQETKK